jgi:hypothetical protein
MVTPIDKQAIAKAYAGWAPVYDLVFGSVCDTGRKVSAASSMSGSGHLARLLSPHNRIFGVDYWGRCCASRNSASPCMTLPLSKRSPSWMHSG